MGIATRDCGIGRTVVVLADQMLGLRGVEKLQIGLCRLARAVGVGIALHHRHRRLGQDADRGCHDVELALAQFLLRQIGLVLPGQQHVADAALGEGDERTACAGVQHRHLAVELAHEITCLLLRASLFQGPAPGGQIVPARATGGLGVGRDHRHPRLDQIAPVADGLGVALAYQKHDGAAVGRAVLWQAFLPVGRQQPGLRQLVDIGRQRQRDYIRLHAVEHRQRLLARAAMRLAHLHVGTGRLAVAGGEGLVDVLIQLARRVVTDVQQSHRCVAGLGQGGGSDGGGCQGQAGAGEGVQQLAAGGGWELHDHVLSVSIKLKVMVFVFLMQLKEYKVASVLPAVFRSAGYLQRPVRPLRPASAPPECGRWGARSCAADGRCCRPSRRA